MRQYICFKLNFCFRIGIIWWWMDGKILLIEYILDDQQCQTRKLHYTLAIVKEITRKSSSIFRVWLIFFLQRFLFYWTHTKKILEINFNFPAAHWSNIELFWHTYVCFGFICSYKFLNLLLKEWKLVNGDEHFSHLKLNWFAAIIWEISGKQM